MKRIILLISVLVMLLLVGCSNEVDTNSTRIQYPKNTKDLNLEFKKLKMILRHQKMDLFIMI